MPLFNTILRGLLGATKLAKHWVSVSLDKMKQIADFFDDVENRNGIIPMVINDEVDHFMNNAFSGWGVTLPRVVSLVEDIEHVKVFFRHWSDERNPFE